MRSRFLIIALMTILCSKSYCQIVFENGYFINEANEKVDCLIKNMDWEKNPTEFEYKLSPNEAVQKATIQDVKEFGINNVSKYIRAKVNIDRSTAQINKLSTNKSPSFHEELLFLKVLVEGQASLYLYFNNNLTRLFYKLNDSAINQLVYKKYLAGKKISENNYYKQQLFLQLKCEGIDLKDLEHLSYSCRDLKRLFSEYNRCVSSNYVSYDIRPKRDLYNLTIRPGVNISRLEIQNIMQDPRNNDFGNQVGMRFGVENEFILPFNKSKWSILIEPTYQYYQSERIKKLYDNPAETLVSKVDYKSIELPIGVRHYLHLTDQSKLFVDISYVFDFAKKDGMEFYTQNYSDDSSLDISSRRRSLAIGMGYKFKDKFGIEMRYMTSRDILDRYLFWNAPYRTTSIVFGYSLY